MSVDTCKIIDETIAVLNEKEWEQGHYFGNGEGRTVYAVDPNPNRALPLRLDEIENVQDAKACCFAGAFLIAADRVKGTEGVFGKISRASELEWIAFCNAVRDITDRSVATYNDTVAKSKEDVINVAEKVKAKLCS